MTGPRNGKYLESFAKLLGILDRLRAPEGGCPWDVRQGKEDIARYLLEEAYEVVEAVDSGSAPGLREELGDLLFQILFLTKISEEKGEFDLNGVFEEIAGKMIRRHPHVFGDVTVRDAAEVKENWEDIKRNVEGKEKTDAFLGVRIPRSLPALRRAQKITSEASRVGFDWKDMGGVLEKVQEELAEFRSAAEAADPEKAAEEVGDLLFSIVNLSRFAGVDAEEALRASTKKFTDRFGYIEKKLAEAGRTPGGASLDEMDGLWNESKKIRKGTEKG